MDLQTLSIEDLVAIHNVLVADFSASDDPISPSGVKNMSLLESAVGRQLSGTTDRLQYPLAIPNAATLVYGVCCNHAFHNGNKRTALVALLVHLDRNKLCLVDTKQNELYELMLRIAGHSISVRSDPRRRGPPKRPRPDEEINAIAHWIAQRASKVTRGERQITYRELKRILDGFGFALQNPKGNYIDIVRRQHIPKTLLRKERVREIHIGSVGYPGEHRVVSIADIKKVRRICALDEIHGVDSAAFYDDAAVIDAFVNRYRTVLRRLAST